MAEAEDLSRLRSIQTGSGTRPFSYSVGTGCSFPRGEWGMKLTIYLRVCVTACQYLLTVHVG